MIKVAMNVVGQLGVEISTGFHHREREEKVSEDMKEERRLEKGLQKHKSSHLHHG